MRRYIHISVAAAVIAAFLVLYMAPLPVSAGDRQGTDGTEMGVYKAEQLEIKLGSGWAGKEFRLETDAGIYPDSLKADADGVIRTELGGSTSYILTAVDNRKDASGALPVDRTETGKTPERTEAGTVNEFHSGTVSQPQVTGNEEKERVPAEPEAATENRKMTAAGIPPVYLVLFVLGLFLAIDGLILIHLLQKRKRHAAGYEGYDDYDAGYNDGYEDGYDDYDDGYEDE